MYLTEQGQVADAALPVANLRSHLRLGWGFADDAEQDRQLAARLRAALAEIEGLTGKALIRRTFEVHYAAWRDLGRQALPRSPVQAVSAFRIVDLENTERAVSSGAWALVPDAHSPAIVARGFVLPTIPVGGRAEIVFEAGLATDWSELPADLSDALVMLAATRFENRLGDGGLPVAVGATLARHRAPRLSRGI